MLLFMLPLIKLSEKHNMSKWKLISEYVVRIFQSENHLMTDDPQHAERTIRVWWQIGLWLHWGVRTSRGCHNGSLVDSERYQNAPRTTHISHETELLKKYECKKNSHFSTPFLLLIVLLLLLLPFYVLIIAGCINNAQYILFYRPKI